MIRVMIVHSGKGGEEGRGGKFTLIPSISPPENELRFKEI